MSGSEPADDWFDDQHSTDNEEEVDQHWESARFLLRMTEEHSLTHAGVDSFCDSTQWFVENICSQISKRVEASLPPSVDSQHRKDIVEASLPPSVDSQHRKDILQECIPGDLFAGLKSRYSREKYYCDHINYVVRSILWIRSAS